VRQRASRPARIFLLGAKRGRVPLGDNIRWTWRIWWRRGALERHRAARRALRGTSRYRALASARRTALRASTFGCCVRSGCAPLPC